MRHVNIACYRLDLLLWLHFFDFDVYYYIIIIIIIIITVIISSINNISCWDYILHKDRRVYIDLQTSSISWNSVQ